MERKSLFKAEVEAGKYFEIYSEDGVVKFSAQGLGLHDSAEAFLNMVNGCANAALPEQSTPVNELGELQEVSGSVAEAVVSEPELVAVSEQETPQVAS